MVPCSWAISAAAAIDGANAWPGARDPVRRGDAAAPALAQRRGFFRTNRPALTAVVVMATIPVLVLYIFFQRYFTAGVGVSGAKG